MMKSVLLAQASSPYLLHPPPLNSPPDVILAFVRSWEESDRASRAEIDLKGAGGRFYSTVRCSSEVAGVLAKLESIRQSEFGGVNSSARNPRGVRKSKAADAGALFLSPRATKAAVKAAAKKSEEEPPATPRSARMILEAREYSASRVSVSPGPASPNVDDDDSDCHSDAGIGAGILNDM
jgi:hypothetical protein